MKFYSTLNAAKFFVGRAFAMKNIAIIIGTRPEAIKMAPVYLALKERFGASVQLVSTGQHRELLWPRPSLL
jgi:hypothetical protein